MYITHHCQTCILHSRIINNYIVNLYNYTWSLYDKQCYLMFTNNVHDKSMYDDSEVTLLVPFHFLAGGSVSKVTSPVDNKEYRDANKTCFCWFFFDIILMQCTILCYHKAMFFFCKKLFHIIGIKPNCW